MNIVTFEKNQHFKVRFWGVEGVNKKSTLCTLSQMSIIVNDPLMLSTYRFLQQHSLKLNSRQHSAIHTHCIIFHCNTLYNHNI